MTRIELMALYGEQCIQLEILQHEQQKTKQQIINLINEDMLINKYETSKIGINNNK